MADKSGKLEVTDKNIQEGIDATVNQLEDLIKTLQSRIEKIKNFRTLEEFTPHFIMSGIVGSDKGLQMDVIGFGPMQTISSILADLLNGCYDTPSYRKMVMAAIIGHTEHCIRAHTPEKQDDISQLMELLGVNFEGKLPN